MGLFDILNYAGETLDKPGSALRGALAGRPDQLLNLIPFSDTLGITDPSRRTSGRDVLERWGAMGENQEGLDWGDAAGFGLEMAADPMNLIGGGLLAKALKGKSAAAKSNAIRNSLLDAGAIPGEAAAATKVAAGKSPLPVYHGTPVAFDDFDATKFDPKGLYGPGVYTTSSPDVASGYAKTQSENPWVSKAVPKMPEDELVAKLRETEKSQGHYFADRSDPEIFKRKWEQIAKGAYEGPYGGHYGISPDDKKIAESLFDVTLSHAEPLNVRKHYLDIRNPFVVDKLVPERYDIPSVIHPKESLQKINAAAANALGMSVDDISQTASGQSVYDTLRDLAKAKFGAERSKAVANQILQDAGFDGIQHVGGRNTNRGLHDVFIAFSPEQVYSPWVAPAYQKPPMVSPIAAALAAQNSLTAPSRWS